MADVQKGMLQIDAPRVENFWLRHWQWFTLLLHVYPSVESRRLCKFEKNEIQLERSINKSLNKRQSRPL